MTGHSREKTTARLSKDARDKRRQTHAHTKTTSCACDMNDGVVRLKRRGNRLRRLGTNICQVLWDQSGLTDWLTCFHWCRCRCFPPHTAPVLGKHAEPVEQSGPGKIKWKVEQIHYLNRHRSRRDERDTNTQSQVGWPYLLLHRHLLGGTSRLDRHGGLERDSGGGVSACFRGLHGA